MKPLLLLTLLAAFISSARATDSYEYKPGEYRVIEHGLSPDKQYSLAAGVSGDSFHIFLMDARAKKKIGPLTEIEEILDTGPDSYHAAWSPDSRHVAITYRADRHLLVMKLYRVEDRRAFAVTYEALFDAVAPKFDREAHEMTDTSRGMTSLSWKSPTQFELSETSHYYHVHHSPKAKLGKFGKITKDDSDSEDKSALAVQFSADALCELTEKDGIKVITLKPGKFSDE